MVIQKYAFIHAKGWKIKSPAIPKNNEAFWKRAEDGTRTRDPNLGKVMLYQLSYFRIYNRFVLDCECKGSDFIETTKPLRYFFIGFF